MSNETRRIMLVEDEKAIRDAVTAYLERETYSILSAANHCVDYGEYPASEGVCSNFVTFATIKDSSSGYPSTVTVRNFAL